MIKAAGIDNTNTQLLINAINPIFSMMGAIAGAAMLDKLGRRPMMMYSLGACLVFYILLTAFSAHSDDVKGLSYGVIVAIYLFGIFFAWGFTPLQTLYSVECLENRTRAKGSGANFLFLNIAMVINTYGISEGMAKIGWKLCKFRYASPPSSQPPPPPHGPADTSCLDIVYCVWIAVEIVVIYFFAVETAGKTLEELSSIFNAKNPRKESTKKTKIEVDEAGNVLNIGGH
jgi:MFS family permease